MTRLSWGTPGERFYESGIDRGVLYVDNAGFAWSGLISVQEKSSGGTATPYYIDGYKYAQVASAEEFEATIEAFSAPREFYPCDGSFEYGNGLVMTQQPRKSFGLSYRTRIGNDTIGPELGYKIHIVYNALAAPSSRSNQTAQETPTPTTLSWELTTQPPKITGARPTAHYIVDSLRTDPAVLSALEDELYGTESTSPTLPTAAELIAMFS